MSEEQRPFQLFVRPADTSRAGEKGELLSSPFVGEHKARRRILPPPASLAGTLPDPMFNSLFDWAFRHVRLAPQVVEMIERSGRPVQTELVLFNVLVALEWAPDEQFRGVLQDVFAKVANLLYDLTDGYMTIGQVVVGGMELMDCADIQIFASNRFYPRTGVDGLTVAHKYQPIRLGRGLWDKQERRTIAWDEGIGPQTIVHEWCHYALGMKDRYFQLDDDRFVVPVLSPAENSVMADVEASELSTRRNGAAAQDDASDWEMLSEHPAYRELSIKVHTPREPEEALVPAPAFHVVGSAAHAQPTRRLPWQDVLAKYQIEPEHCWVYVVKGAGITQPQAMIAQGKLEAPFDSFPLYGAADGDTVVLIGSTGRGQDFRPLVVYAAVEPATSGAAWDWNDATPSVAENGAAQFAFPLVDVTVEEKDSTTTPPRYRIRVDGFDSTWAPWVFPLGTGGVKDMADNTPLASLEGHVMLVSTAGRTQLTIASYSVGGSPSESGFPGHPNPLPAGSPEGNAMLFFYDQAHGPIDPRLQFSEAELEPLARHYEQFKIVTVTNLLNDAEAPGEWQPCSYAFTISTNTSFKTLLAGETVGGVPTRDLKPTLVLYYDKDTDNSKSGGERLTIGWYDSASKTWNDITRAGKKHKPRKGFLMALALDATTAPGLFADEPWPEHYRLFKKIDA